MTTDLSNAPHASILKRFAAMVYDALLLFGVLFTATLIPALILNKPQQQNANGDIVYELHPLMTGVGFQVYLVLLLMLFFCFFWRKQGQTLGMQAWKLKLVDQNNGNPNVKQCLLRFLFAIVSFVPAGLGYWWLWFDKDNLTWHDRWSKTRVLQLSKEQQQQAKLEKK